MRFNRRNVFRFNDLPAELQESIFDRYFEDNSYTVIPIYRKNALKPESLKKVLSLRSRVESRFNILNVLLVSRKFRNESVAAIARRGVGVLSIASSIKSSSPKLRRLKKFCALRRSLDAGVVWFYTPWVPMTTGPLLQRFENLRHIVLKDLYDIDTDYRNLFNLLAHCAITDIASGALEAQITRCARQDVQNVLGESDIFHNEISHLRKMTVYWQGRFDMHEWCGCNRGRCFLEHRELCIKFGHGHQRTQVLDIEVSLPEGGRYPSFIYKGKGTELNDLALWQEARRAGDKSRCKELKALWSLDFYLSLRRELEMRAEDEELYGDPFEYYDEEEEEEQSETGSEGDEEEDEDGESEDEVQIVGHYGV